MSCEYNRERPIAFRDNEWSDGCQFENASTTEFQGRKYCKFHLPLEVGKSDWLNAQIEDFNREIAAFLTKGKFDLTGVVFPGGFDFSTTTNALFQQGVCLYEAYFADTAVFDDASFGRHACFDRTIFEKDAKFRRVRFPHNATFVGARLNGNVSFHSAKFGAGTLFSDTRIKGHSVFSDAEFHGAAHFYPNLIFGEAVHFQRTGFNAEVEFEGAIFNGAADFSAATTNDAELQFRSFLYSDFSHAIFLDRVTFNFRQFLDRANFSDCNFSRAPEFHNCVLHPDTDFSRLRLPKKEPDWNGARRHYRTLKRLMGDVRERDDEALFYAREQICLRHIPETPLWVKSLSLLYGLMSDYGRSALRPIFWLLLTMACFSVAYWRISGLVGPPAFIESASFMVEQIVRPFSILVSTYKSEFGWVSKALMDRPICLKLLTTAQSMTHLSLIAIFVLAIRWRFRRA